MSQTNSVYNKELCYLSRSNMAGSLTDATVNGWLQSLGLCFFVYTFVHNSGISALASIAFIVASYRHSVLKQVPNVYKPIHDMNVRLANSSIGVKLCEILVPRIETAVVSVILKFQKTGLDKVRLPKFVLSRSKWLAEMLGLEFIIEMYREVTQRKTQE